MASRSFFPKVDLEQVWELLPCRTQPHHGHQRFRDDEEQTEDVPSSSAATMDLLPGDAEATAAPFMERATPQTNAMFFDRMTVVRRCPRGAPYAAGAVALLGLLFLLARTGGGMAPTWEVTGLSVRYIDLPGLRGIIPADTRNCPNSDPCGLGHARGCSTCPGTEMWNNGCLCRKNSAGEMKQADSSACPPHDRCGLTDAHRGCAFCEDSSWIREGCNCRQPPMSASEFFSDVGDFLGSVLGVMPTVVKMEIRATAEVYNPADVGARAEPGIFNISYRGQTIGSASTKPTKIGPRSSSTVSADVQVDKVPTELGIMLLQDVVNDGTHLPVQVSGSVVAVAGPFSVHCYVYCALEADVSALPEAKFTKKDCSYTYGM